VDWTRGSPVVVQRPVTTSAWNDDVDGVVQPPDERLSKRQERHSASVFPENVHETAEKPSAPITIHGCIRAVEMGCKNI